MKCKIEEGEAPVLHVRRASLGIGWLILVETINHSIFDDDYLAPINLPFGCLHYLQAGWLRFSLDSGDIISRHH